MSVRPESEPSPTGREAFASQAGLGPADLLPLLLEGTPCAVLAESVDRRVLAVNEHFVRLFRPAGPHASLTGTNAQLAHRIPPDMLADPDAFTRRIEELAEAAVTVRGERVALSDGRVYSRDYLPLLDDNGQLTGHLWLYRDVSGSERAQRTLVQGQRLDAIQRLAGGVAHDLNNILTAIIGHASLLEPEVVEHPEIADSVREIRGAADRAAALTQDLLAFSRRQVLHPQRVDLRELLRPVESMLRRVVGEQVRLEVVLPGGATPVRVDPGKLERTILSLALNAREAMPEGGRLSLVVGTTTVSDEEALSFPFPFAPGRYALLTMSDTGPGVPEENWSHVFEPFFSTKERGAGLGLSTVYGFVKQSGGYVWVEETANGGATFRVALPLAEGAADVRAVARETSARPAEARTSRTVLVAEDEPALRTLLQRAFTAIGFRVLLAPDGAEALELLRADPDGVDLLVTDVMMPRLNGLELAREARRLRSTLPLLIMSGYSADVVREMESIGEDVQLVEKPFSAISVAKLAGAMLDA